MSTNTAHMTHMTPEGFDLNLVLSNTQTLPIALLDSVLEHVKHQLPTLRSERPYTLKQMCDKEFWNALPKEDKLLAGQCMSYLVKTHRLPFMPDGHVHASIQYRLI